MDSRHKKGDITVRSWYRQGIAVILLCITIILIVLIGHLYFQYVSKCVYEESTNYLVEIYNQVNHNFRSFLEKNWKSLQDWVYYIQSEEDDHILDFIKIRQREFKFSGVYPPQLLLLLPERILRTVWPPYW